MESGHTPSRGKAEYWDGDIPWIGIRDATGNHGLTINATEQHITDAGLDNSSARLLPAGTVCLSRTASVGFVVTMGVDMATSQDFVNWVCGPELSSRYLHYILVGEQESVRRFAHGTTHQTMYYPEAKALHVLLPHRREQDAIAEVLGALDDRIAANTKLTNTIDEYLGTLFAAEVALCEDAKPLRELAQINAESVKPVTGGSLRYIDIASVGIGRYDYPSASDWAEAPGRARRRVRKGDVLWSTVRPNRRSHALNLSNDPSLVGSTGLAVLTPSTVGFAYLYEVTRLPAFTAFLESAAEGSAYPAVRADRFADAIVPWLSRPDRETFEGIAAPMREHAHSLESENRHLTAMREALLPQLMSGRIRVKSAEQMVGDVV